MQPLLAGVARYLERRLSVLPMGLTGTERLFPIGDANRVPLTWIVADRREACAIGTDRRWTDGRRSQCPRYGAHAQQISD